MKHQTIGVVAKKAGVNVETIRSYERKGLIEKPHVIATAYREYPTDTANRVLFIKRAQKLGFSLSEIGELLQLTQLASSSRREVKEIATTKLSSIRQKIDSLQRLEETS